MVRVKIDKIVNLWFESIQLNKFMVEIDYFFF